MTDRQEIGLLLRQRAEVLRDGTIGNEDHHGYEGNAQCSRELINLAARIEAGDNAEAPMRETAWHREVDDLRSQVARAEEQHAALVEAAQEAIFDLCPECGVHTVVEERNGTWVHPESDVMPICASRHIRAALAALESKP